MTGTELVIRRITGMAVIVVFCVLPFSVYSFSGKEAFELLSRESKEISEFPFHVYSVREHTGFEGVRLPVSAYDFFASAYGDLKNAEMPGEVFAVHKFSQDSRWKCFLLRVPGMYASDAIDLWVFDTGRGTWQQPLRLADWWSDGGYEMNIQAWVEDLNKDGWLDIVRRSLETDMDLDDPKEGTIVKRKTDVFIWDKDRFRDATQEYLPGLSLKKYRFSKEGGK